MAGIVVSIIAFESECVAAAADGEASLLASAMSAIGMTDTSPPAAPPPPPEPNFTAGWIFLGLMSFLCVVGWGVAWTAVRESHETNNNLVGAYRR